MSKLRTVILRAAALGAVSLFVADAGCKRGAKSDAEGAALGQVVCWGLGQSGQLGSGSLSSSTQPVTVVGLPGPADALFVGSSSSCAHVAAGVRCWGEAGGGGAVAPLAEVPDAVEVGFGSMHTCARRASGQVACWGNNLVGTLGNGKAPDPKTKVAMRVGPNGVEVLDPLPSGAGSKAAVTVTGVTDAVQIASGKSHTCVRLRGGQIQCWGSNQLGQLGIGTNDSSVDHPVAVDIADATQLWAGYSYSCARRQNGSVWCWGSLSDAYGGSPTVHRKPTELSAVKDASSLSIQEMAACAVVADGAVLCWSDAHPPEREPDVEPATQVVSGMRHSCALTKTAKVMCWGDDYEGSLGVESAQRDARHSIAIPGLDKVVEIAAGARHTCARRDIAPTVATRPAK